MNKIREILRSYDDAALEALSNKGLLRRTRRDLELSQPRILRVTDDEIVVSFEKCEVKISVAGPSKAGCTCPASGICRHILAAILYLQTGEENGLQDNEEIFKQVDSTSESNQLPEQNRLIDQETSSIIEEILTLDIKQIQKWAGKANLRKAIELLSEDIEILEADPRRIVVQIPKEDIKVFLMRGAGLDGIIVNGVSKDSRSEATAAILYCRKKYGCQDPEFNQENNQPSQSIDYGAIEKVSHLLEEMMEVGISHLSESFSERLITAALATVSAQLPRLSLLLRSLSEEVDQTIDRTAQANEARLLRLLVQTYSLSQTLLINREHFKPDWIGQSRTDYERIDSLELQCVGAYRWESKSDYHGITLLFWNEREGEWLTWSEARPKFHATGFNPTSRYLESAPWEIGASLEVLARSRFELNHPRKNHLNRLSSSEATTGRLLGVVAPDVLNWGERLFTDWQKLASYGYKGIQLGLGSYQPLREVIILKPTGWERRGFDPIQQEFLWPIRDEQGQIIQLRIPFDSVNESSISIMEDLNVKSEEVWGIVGRLAIRNGTVFVYPISLLCDRADHPVIHLTLEKRIQKPLKWISKIIGEKRKNRTMDYFESSEAQNDNSIAIFAEVEDLLLSCAERGSSRLKNKECERLKVMVELLRQQCLPILANSIENYIKSASSKNLLSAAYIVHLHQQATVKANGFS